MLVRRSVVLVATAALAGAGLSLAGVPSRASAAPAAVHHVKLGQGGRVIIVLRDQAAQARPGRSAATRNAAVSVRSALSTQISHAGFHVTHAYSVVNALAATVSQSEADSIAGNSAVAEVIPDAVIRESAATTPAAAAAPAARAGIAPPTGTCAANGGVKLEPEALEATRADSDVPGAKTARSLGITGAGVTVAYIADGLDPNNPDFIRDGKSIFTDFQDFSGDGINSPTGGDEAFLDASAIAAQGNKTYDVSHFSDLPLSTACKIRIEGEAPGANLVGLNIFGDEDAGFNSSFLQAIDYSVNVDHVNVLNESLGSNPYPDDPASLDLIKQANDDAVAAGTTVTASSGDAGITGTTGSPATDPAVISVGASTTYQFFLATGYGGARLPGIKSWVSDNISSLSSGGTDQAGDTVSLVAPGELNYALCSKNLKKFSECTDYRGKAIGVEASGGTSESAPVTAGVAALVIQAYRTKHDGSSPTPAVVKTILTSTADDIGAPADQQGAGLVDAYKAVQLAESYNAKKNVGATLLSSTTQFDVTGSVGQTQQVTDTVTNTGATSQTVHASGRTLGAYQQIAATSVTLSDANSPKYLDFQGLEDNAEKITFTVPAGENRLETSLAYQASSAALSARVRLDLIDPSGRLNAYSLPQGIGNYGHVEVANPMPGTWTGYVTSRETSGGGTVGVVKVATAVAQYTSFGTASPATFTLAPGAATAVTLTVPGASAPGDEAGSLQLTSGTSAAPAPGTGAGEDVNTSSIPVIVRTLIPQGKQSYSETLTGGNGRESGTGVESFYNIDVPAGTPELNADVVLPDTTNPVFDELVSPSGNAVASGGNVALQQSGKTTVSVPTVGAPLSALAPAAGRWTLIVVFPGTVSGTAISTPYTISTDETAVPVSAVGLPSGSTIKSGKTVTAYVTVKNTNKTPEALFVDPRLTQTTTLALAPLTGATTVEPLRAGDNVPLYLVPTGTTSIAGAASTDGPAPIQFDMGWAVGDPDVGSATGSAVAASYSAAPVPQGEWDIAPTEVGPYDHPGTTETVTTSMTATTQAFDADISSKTGDLWALSTNLDASVTPVIVGPGETVTIPVKVTATGNARTVTGTLFVDAASLGGPGFTQLNANEVAALPYSYTVK